MTNYIDIRQIPSPRTRHNYPYEEWAAIPEGKALEITDQLNGRPIKNVQASGSMYIKAHGLAITFMRRGDRLWVAHPRKAKP